MCPGVFLQNKDSLIIEGPPQQKGVQIPTCHGIDSIASVSNISMLIVSTGSSLVLDAGSRTYIRSGGAIYVKQNGSLVIKDGAFLQIGDDRGKGGAKLLQSKVHTFILNLMLILNIDASLETLQIETW